MQITFYTIKDCSFCTAEKEYLNSKLLPFTEKDVEKSKEALTEMLHLSDNFAGVPFTHIIKDDGSEVKLKGFTKEEFDEALDAATPTAPIDSTMPTQTAISAAPTIPVTPADPIQDQSAVPLTTPVQTPSTAGLPTDTLSDNATMPTTPPTTIPTISQDTATPSSPAGGSTPQSSIPSSPTIPPAITPQSTTPTSATPAMPDIPSFQK